MLRQKASRSPSLVHEQSNVQSLELGLHFRALHVVPDSCEIRSKDRPGYRERIVRSRDRDHIVGLNHFAPERSRDLLRTPPDRQHGRARCTAEIELRQTPAHRDALGDDSNRNGLAESGQNGVDVLEQLRLVR